MGLASKLQGLTFQVDFTLQYSAVVTLQIQTLLSQRRVHFEQIFSIKYLQKSGHILYITATCIKDWVCIIVDEKDCEKLLNFM